MTAWTVFVLAVGVAGGYVIRAVIAAVERNAR
jgi:hypothetical protein